MPRFGQSCNYCKDHLIIFGGELKLNMLASKHRECVF